MIIKSHVQVHLFFLTKPNEIEETILKDRGIISLVSDDDNPGVGLYNFLESLL